MNKDINYEHLSNLGDKVKIGIASKEERDEFMLLLFENNSITLKQYNDYKNNRNAEEILNAALAIGAIVLIGYLLKEVLKG